MRTVSSPEVASDEEAMNGLPERVQEALGELAEVGQQIGQGTIARGGLIGGRRSVPPWSGSQLVPRR